MEIRCRRSDGSSDLGGGDRASGGEDSTFAPLTAVEQSGEGTEKGLLTDEVKAAENTNEDRTARHKKIRAMALIPC